MATINVLVRWADNTADLKRNLQQGVNQIEATKASVEKLVQSFSGERLIQAAHRNVAAIKEMGSASLLSASQAQRSLSIISDAIATLERQSKPVPDALREMKAELEGVVRQAPAVEGIGARITGLVAAAAAAREAIRGLVGIVREWIAASSEQEDALVRLDTALRAQGTFTPQLSQQYADLAEQFQNTTVFSDELVMEMQALLIQVGNVMPNQMGKALQAATDLAAGLRIDLQTATMLVGKAFAGETGTLKRYGIVIDEVALKTKGADAVLEAIANKMGGQAAAQAQTFSGQMARLGNVINDVMEILGRFIASILKPLIDLFMDLPEPVRTGAVVVGLLGTAAGATAIAIAGLSAAVALALPLFGMSAAGAGATALAALGTAAATAAAAFWPLAAAIAAVWAAWKIGNTETVKNIVAEWALSSDNLTAMLFRAVMGFDQMSAAEARSAVAATNAADAQRRLNTELQKSISFMRPVASHGGTAGQQTFASTIRAAEQEIAALTAAKRTDLAIAVQSGVFGMEELRKQSGLSDMAIKMFKDRLDETAQSLKKSTEALSQWNERVAEFSGPATRWNAQLDLMHFKLNQQADALLLADQRAIGYLGTLEEFTRVQIPEFPSRSIGSGIGLPPVAIPTQTFDPAIDKVEVLQKNLRLVDSILSGINAKWAQMATVAVRAIDGVVTNLMEGDWLGAITAGVSGLIGLISGANRTIDTVINPARDKFFNAAGGLEKLNAQMMQLTGHVGLVKAVFDADTVEEFEKAVADVNEVLEANRRVIEDAFGIYEDVREKFEGIVVLTPDLEAALDRAMDADTALEMRDALRDINSELDTQKKRYNDINGLLEKYKIPATEVTDPVFKGQFIGGQAADFRKEFDIVKSAGIDLNVFWRAAGDNLRKFITDAQKMGVELPLAMQEVIQTAIDAGEVYDENGGKITDITQLGLTFGSTMETVVGRIETVMDRLLLVLEGLARFFNVDLPEAARDGAAGVQDAFDNMPAPPKIVVPVEYDYPDPADYHTETQGFTYGEGRPGDIGGAFRGGLVTAHGVQHFAQGGKVLPFVPRGIDTVPAMLAVGEGVVNRTGMGVLGEDGLRGLNSGRGSGESGSVVINFHEGAFQAGALIHQDDVEDFMSSATLKAIEKGGRKFGRFSKLVRQAS